MWNTPVTDEVYIGDHYSIACLRGGTDSWDESQPRRSVKESGRLAWLAAQLAWRARPLLLFAILLLLIVQGLLPPIQLALS